mmetsp:Transcript_72626/g.205344  ORF Transcript_72626/g.205344 Transcript_72626/m.205344 type:complete len:215 (+) Transcript_72626:1004-1648(+)
MSWPTPATKAGTTVWQKSARTGPGTCTAAPAGLAPPRPQAGPKTSLSSKSATCGRCAGSPSASDRIQPHAPGRDQKSGHAMHARIAFAVTTRSSHSMLRTAHTFFMSAVSDISASSASTGLPPSIATSSLSAGARRTVRTISGVSPVTAPASPESRRARSKTPGAQAFTSCAAGHARGASPPAAPQEASPAAAPGPGVAPAPAETALPTTPTNV